MRDHKLALPVQQLPVLLSQAYRKDLPRTFLPEFGSANNLHREFGSTSHSGRLLDPPYSVTGLNNMGFRVNHHFALRLMPIREYCPYSWRGPDDPDLSCVTRGTVPPQGPAKWRTRRGTGLRAVYDLSRGIQVTGSLANPGQISRLQHRRTCGERKPACLRPFLERSRHPGYRNKSQLDMSPLSMERVRVLLNVWVGRKRNPGHPSVYHQQPRNHLLNLSAGKRGGRQ